MNELGIEERESSLSTQIMDYVSTQKWILKVHSGIRVELNQFSQNKEMAGKKQDAIWQGQ